MSDTDTDKILGWSEAEKHLDLEKTGVSNRQIALNVSVWTFSIAKSRPSDGRSDIRESAWVSSAAAC